MKYRFSKIWEYEYACDVEADSYEEAKKLAEISDDWYEAETEHWVAMERWKCADIPEKEDDEDEYDYAVKVDDLWAEEDWNVTYDQNEL